MATQALFLACRINSLPGANAVGRVIEPSRKELNRAAGFASELDLSFAASRSLDTGVAVDPSLSQVRGEIAVSGRGLGAVQKVLKVHTTGPLLAEMARRNGDRG